MNILCKFQNCKSKATYGFRFAVPEFCREHGILHNASSQYQICKCGSSVPRYKLLEDERASCCGKCKTEHMINIADRRCECTKHLPTYGFPDDTRANYCSECKKDGMVNLKDKNKKCSCGKVLASFGMPGDKRPTCCVLCKKEGMINLTLDICKKCSKSACYGFKGDKKPSFCLEHKDKDMENIVTKKCKCGKAVPVFGMKHDKRPICCLSCKTEEMINIGAKKCVCGSAQPSFGYPTNKIPQHCSKCKKDGMIDIRSPKCKCGKSQPAFGNEGDTKATCCFDCKSEGMKNIKAKMCKCGKSQPFFGLPADTKATCCSSCKTDGMVDILSTKRPTRKCKGTFELQKEGLKCPYDHRGKKKYDYYCTACFEQNFPDDERSLNIRDKTEENIVRDFLNRNYTPSFTHNKSLWTGQADCTCRRRIDFHALVGNTMLCIEVDEDQHKYRDQGDEVLRYDDLMMIHGGKFIFIRYNPHLYIDSDGKRKNISKDKRLDKLKEEINKQLLRIYECKNTELLEIIHLFYDASAAKHPLTQPPKSLDAIY